MGLGFSELLVSQHGAGSSFGSFTTAKTVLPPQALYSIPAGSPFWFIGKTLRIKVWGGLGTLVTTPGTVTFQVMIGSSIAFTTGAIQLNATAHTNLPFELEVMATLRSEGSGTTATLSGIGRLCGVMFTLTAAQVDAVNTSGAYMVPATAPAVGAGFDSTIANVIDFWTGFSINNAANTVQLFHYTVEALN